MIQDVSWIIDPLVEAGFNSERPEEFRGRSFMLRAMKVTVVDVACQDGKVTLTLDHPQIHHFTYPEGMEF